MLSLIKANIYFMAPLIFLSILSLAIIIERAFVLALTGALSDKRFSRIITALRLKDMTAIHGYIKNNRTPLDYLFRIAFTQENQSLEVLIPTLEGTALEWMNKLEKRISLLHGISNIATLLGLFGTVTGMIRTFQDMQSSGASDPAVLAGGISQALVTTAAGLFVAIPSLFAFYYFSDNIEKRSKEMDISINEILAYHQRRPL